MKLHVEWLERTGYWNGGCWALVMANGHLFAEPSQKGRHARTKAQLEKLAKLWNGAQS